MWKIAHSFAYPSSKNDDSSVTFVTTVHQIDQQEFVLFISDFIFSDKVDGVFYTLHVITLPFHASALHTIAVLFHFGLSVGCVLRPIDSEVI